jgi:eukaryotic-like serine/threonine-protein kinase
VNSETISYYRILNKLGEGGMGEVYLAEDTRLGRQVALKILPASFEYDPERRARFLREARAASALRSPNVAAIYDIGEHDGSQFIAMEYVEGELLADKIRRHSLPILEAVDIAFQIADALDEAHLLGIIHRDIKCSNLIVNKRGLVKVLDFGLAKLLTSQHQEDADGDRTLRFGQETTPGMILGTLCYMSPEQTRGVALDSRTDIFSLGVVLYEMVTGCKPFKGETTSDLIVSILEREPAPLAQGSGEIPAQLEWIIAKALQKKREQRYQSAKEIIVDLRNLKQALELEANLLRTTPLDRDSGSIDNRTRLMDSADFKTSEDSSTDSHSAPTPKRRSRKAINSIAILPLVNASSDPNMEYLSDGITEVLINSLSRLPKLRVMARSTTFRYKGRDIDPLQVGNDLGVRAVLTGRVRQINGNLIIGTELVDVSDGSQLWGEQYNRKMSDIFSLQEEISNEILDKLRLRLGGREKKLAVNCCTRSTEAYDLYLKGRFHFNLWDWDGFQRAIEFFDQAIAKDPHFALAYSGLSDTYGALWFLNYMPEQEPLPKAKAAALRALELDETLAEAHLSLANMLLYYEWNWPAAEQEYRRAIELNPNSSHAHHMYAFYLLTLCKFDEALREARRAAELDPLSAKVNCAVSTTLYAAGKYQEAIEHLQKNIEFNPAFPMSHELLGNIYQWKGMGDKAVEEFLQFIPHWIGSQEIADALRAEASQTGVKGFWRKWLEFAVDKSAIPTASPFYIAAACNYLGETDRAFEWLEKAYEARVGFLVHLKNDPHFENIRSHERFQDLVRRIGIP